MTNLNEGVDSVRPTARSRHSGSQIVALWVMANALSGALGVLLMRAVGLAARGDAAVSILAIISFCILPPVVTATMQWAVIRRVLARSGRWLLASGVGYGVGFLVFAGVSSAGVGLLGEESRWVILFS